MTSRHIGNLAGRLARQAFRSAGRAHRSRRRATFSTVAESAKAALKACPRVVRYLRLERSAPCVPAGGEHSLERFGHQAGIADLLCRWNVGQVEPELLAGDCQRAQAHDFMWDAPAAGRWIADGRGIRPSSAPRNGRVRRTCRGIFSTRCRPGSCSSSAVKCGVEP